MGQRLAVMKWSTETGRGALPSGYSSGLPRGFTHWAAPRDLTTVHQYAMVPTPLADRPPVGQCVKRSDSPMNQDGIRTVPHALPHDQDTRSSRSDGSEPASTAAPSTRLMASPSQRGACGSLTGSGAIVFAYDRGFSDLLSETNAKPGSRSTRTIEAASSGVSSVSRASGSPDLGVGRV